MQLFSPIRSNSGVVFPSQLSGGLHFRIFSSFYVFQICSPIILYSCLFVRLLILPVLRSSMLQSARDLSFQLHLVSLMDIRAFPIFPVSHPPSSVSFELLRWLALDFFPLLSYLLICSSKSYRWFTKIFSSFGAISPP